MPIRGLFTRANNVPKRILGCRLIKQSALRGFAAKAKDKIVKKGPIHKGNGIYTPHREKLFKLQNGYYILFLHKQAWYTIPLLYMRFLVPLAIFTVAIKKNPFYRNYPIMLPIMIFLWCFTVYRAVAYSRRTNRMV